MAAAATNSGEIRVDPLQRLHTLQNLAWLLGPAGDGVPSVPRTLRDGNLQASRPRLDCSHVQSEHLSDVFVCGTKSVAPS